MMKLLIQTIPSMTELITAADDGTPVMLEHVLNWAAAKAIPWIRKWTMFVARSERELSLYNGQHVLIVEPWAGCDLESGAIIESRKTRDEGVLNVLTGEFLGATGDPDSDDAFSYQHCDPPRLVVLTQDDDSVVSQVLDCEISLWVDDGDESTHKQIPLRCAATEQEK